MITQEQLKEILDYDPDTGIFVWKVSRGRSKAGNVAGFVTNNYMSIGIDGVSYYAHRLAWLFVHGSWPSYDTDHINMVKKDNRIANLREATRSENKQNQGKAVVKINGKLFGITWFKRDNKWRAQIMVNGKYKHLGLFNTQEEAHQAYLISKRELHPYCTI